MLFVEALPLLILGFGFGLLHALDADHVMAVSVLSAQKSGFKRTAWHCANWAFGHSGVLIVSGLLLFGLGFAIPESLQHMAEVGVGVLLIVLGLLFIFRLRKNNLKLETHQHGEISHTHWHEEGEGHDKKGLHKPVLVGILHGMAGSAPALALVPAVASGQLLVALAYLILFSLGVTLSMLVFGFSFGYLQTLLNSKYQQMYKAGQYILGAASIGFGGYWLLGAL